MSAYGNAKPFLNLGCGTVTLPGPQPAHHGLIDPIHDYPFWVNVDRNGGPGVDCVFDVFAYPWPLADNTYAGALVAHLIEHCPHEIRLRSASNGDERRQALAEMQSSFFAFFAELWRVLEPGAVAHILWPHPRSEAFVLDPTHTRPLIPASFGYLCENPEIPKLYRYARGGLWTFVKPPDYSIHRHFAHLQDEPDVLGYMATHYYNVLHDCYVKLRVVK